VKTNKYSAKEVEYLFFNQKKMKLQIHQQISISKGGKIFLTLLLLIFFVNISIAQTLDNKNIELSKNKQKDQINSKTIDRKYSQPAWVSRRVAEQEPYQKSVKEHSIIKEQNDNAPIIKRCEIISLPMVKEETTGIKKRYDNK